MILANNQIFQMNQLTAPDLAPHTFHPETKSAFSCIRVRGLPKDQIRVLTKRAAEHIAELLSRDHLNGGSSPFEQDQVEKDTIADAIDLARFYFSETLSTIRVSSDSAPDPRTSGSS